MISSIPNPFFPPEGPDAGPTRELCALMRRPEGQISLAEAALWIATMEYPKLDRDAYIDQLDALAAPLPERLPQAGEAETDPLRVIEVINHRLFEEAGFRGNSEDYYDPRNSYLNDVMDRRCGIPIMLSTVYLEMAARLKLPLAGVGMPGHYLVRHRYFDLFIDPFDRGKVLTIEDCQERMHKALGHELPFERELLEPAPKLRTVMRMLNNLRNVYAATRQFTRALRIVELALALNPETEGEWEVVLATDLRQRAGLLMEMRRYSPALATLERYLEIDPKADDAADIRKTAANLRRTLAQMN
jgi:regulator of sirC expression with transglutaminase-like and TPR domain